MTNFLEIQFWRVALWLLKRGYGSGCDTWDYEDQGTFMWGTSGKVPVITDKDINSLGRCPSCAAYQVQLWIRGHIALLKD